ncbi:MAG: transglutaminase family protein [Chitinispirillales bacterium]|nr:transglutaminase family protein [Chitinispirillales bacterium]
MKTVRFQYQTELAFSSPASEHTFLLRILPRSDGRQRIESLSWHIDPSPTDTLWRTVDGFGNDVLAGHISAPHSRFRFGTEGVAEVSGEPYISSDEPQRVLLYPTELTRPHRGLADFYDGVNNGINDRMAERSRSRMGVNNGINDGINKNINDNINRSATINALDRVQHFSHAVHARLRYERGATTNTTTASEAFDIGAGVCQDYAHILLALLRMDKIPCRYVAGLASDCGETHAWVEAWTGDRYCAVDPTRDKLTDEGYIALSRGRDFADCSIERGVFNGACRGTQTVGLSMNIS